MKGPKQIEYSRIVIYHFILNAIMRSLVEIDMRTVLEFKSYNQKLIKNITLYLGNI